MFRDVRASILNESGMTLADLQAFITVKVQIQLTIPEHVAHHSVYISYSVKVLHYTLPTTRLYIKYGIKKRDNVGAGWFEASHGGCSSDPGISGDSNATPCWPCLLVIKLEISARGQMQLHVCL